MKPEEKPEAVGSRQPVLLGERRPLYPFGLPRGGARGTPNGRLSVAAAPQPVVGGNTAEGRLLLKERFPSRERLPQQSGARQKAAPLGRSRRAAFF